MGRAGCSTRSAASPTRCGGSCATTTSASTARATRAGSPATTIALDTRILAVCDVYDALISSRVYRPAWTHEEAMALLRERDRHRLRRALRRRRSSEVLARERGGHERARAPAFAGAVATAGA